MPLLKSGPGRDEEADLYEAKNVLWRHFERDRERENRANGKWDLDTLRRRTMKPEYGATGMESFFASFPLQRRQVWMQVKNNKQRRERRRRLRASGDPKVGPHIWDKQMKIDIANRARTSRGTQTSRRVTSAAVKSHGVSSRKKPKPCPKWQRRAKHWIDKPKSIKLMRQAARSSAWPWRR